MRRLFLPSRKRVNHLLRVWHLSWTFAAQECHNSAHEYWRFDTKVTLAWYTLEYYSWYLLLYQDCLLDCAKVGSHMNLNIRRRDYGIQLKHVWVKSRFEEIVGRNSTPYMNPYVCIKYRRICPSSLGTMLMRNPGRNIVLTLFPHVLHRNIEHEEWILL